MFRFGLVLGLSAWVFGTTSAYADDSSDADKARSLFREGRALAATGKFEEACPKFEESLKLDAGIGTEFNLADCREHTGKLKSAQEIFLLVADAAHEKGQAEREQVARDRARAVDQKIPKLAIDVKELVDGLEVLIDDKGVDRTKWASGERVDPGPHDVTAKAPHKKTWSLRVETAAAASVLTITVPKLDDASSKTEPCPAPEAAEKKTTDEKPTSSTASTKASSGNNTLKLLFLGGATAGLVLAGTGLVIYKVGNGNAKEVCPTSVNCTDDDIRRHGDYLDEAATGRAIGFLGLGITGASLIGFTAVAIASPSSRENPSGASFSAAPAVGPGTWGASVRGRF